MQVFYDDGFYRIITKAINDIYDDVKNMFSTILKLQK